MNIHSTFYFIITFFFPHYGIKKECLSDRSSRDIAHANKATRTPFSIFSYNCTSFQLETYWISIETSLDSKLTMERLMAVVRYLIYCHYVVNLLCFSQSFCCIYLCQCKVKHSVYCREISNRIYIVIFFILFYFCNISP